MKLTRRQELAFINYGIEQFTENYIIGSVKDTESKRKHRKWSKEQHKKFSESMRKKWQERNK